MQFQTCCIFFISKETADYSREFSARYALLAKADARKKIFNLVCQGTALAGNVLSILRCERAKTFPNHVSMK